jgi:hypothetical protein
MFRCNIVWVNFSGLDSIIISISSAVYVCLILHASYIWYIYRAKKDVSLNWEMSLKYWRVNTKNVLGRPDQISKSTLWDDAQHLRKDTCWLKESSTHMFCSTRFLTSLNFDALCRYLVPFHVFVWLLYLSFLFLYRKFGPYTCKFSQILTTVVRSKPPEPEAGCTCWWRRQGRQEWRSFVLTKLLNEEGAIGAESPTSATVDSGTRFGCNWWTEQLENSDELYLQLVLQTVSLNC